MIDSGVQGFDTVLEGTDRKEMKSLVKNASAKELGGSTKKRDGPVRRSNRCDLSGFRRVSIVARFKRKGITFIRMDWL